MGEAGEKDGARRSAGGYQGPFGEILRWIPLASRLAVTAGVVVGMIASIVVSNASEMWADVALGVGIGGGVIAAVVVGVRGRSQA